MRPFLPHQQEAMDYALSRSRIALFMEMRLGKSLVAIRWAKVKQGSNRRVLIVAPLTVLSEWQEELRKEGVTQNVYWIRGTKKFLEKVTNPDFIREGWFLVNYECLRANPWICEKRWEVVILDESTLIRNPTSKTSKMACEKLSRIPNRAILSGLPNPESSMDYFQQFKFLYGSFLNTENFWTFRNKFFQRGFTSWDWVPFRGTLEAIKNEVHKLAFIRTRKECGIGSKKIYEARHCYMSSKQQTMYRQTEKDFGFQLNEKESIETLWAPVKFLWLSQISGGFVPKTGDLISTVKTTELINLLEGELKHEKVVVWFRFNSELHYVRKLLSDHGIANVFVVGGRDKSERVRNTAIFRGSSGVRVMLAQVKCAKYGLDWSVASTAIYYSTGYEMENRAQSEDRIIHPTKKEPVLYIDLITKGTVDEEILDCLREKKFNSRSLLLNFTEKLKLKYAKN